VIRLGVVPQVPLLPETEPAHGAHPRLLVGMYESVPLQFILDTEAPAANITFIGFLAGVARDVQQEGRLGAEPLVAVAALERKVVLVRPLVDKKRSFLLERFAAQVAHVGPLVRVDPAVLLDVAPRREHAAAQVAREFFDALVRLAQVAHQPLRHAELLAAQIAHVGPLPRVDPHVPDVGVGRVEVLAALFAVVVDAAVDHHFGGADQFLIDLGVFALLLFDALLGDVHRHLLGQVLDVRLVVLFAVLDLDVVYDGAPHEKNGGTVLTAEVRFLLLAVGLEAHRLVEILQDGALVVLIGQNLVVFDVDLVLGVVDQFGVDQVLLDVGNVRVQRGGSVLGGVARDQVLFFLLFGGFWRFFCVLARRGLAEIIQTCGDGLGLDPANIQTERSV
jgi:hypothetical protein